MAPIDDDLDMRARTVLGIADTVVTITFHCGNHYDAMLLYDKLEHAAVHGGAYVQFRKSKASEEPT